MSDHQPMRPKGQPHPSGKPVHQRKWGTESKPRYPNDGPLSPGLQKRNDAYAVGFVHDFGYDDE